MKTMTRLSAVAAAALLSLGALTACSGGAQSVTDACNSLKGPDHSLNNMTSELSSISNGGNFSSVTNKLDKIAQQYSDAADKVTNEKVAKPAKKAVADLKKLVQAMKDSDGDITKLSGNSDFLDAAQSMTTDGSALEKVCSAG